MAVNDLAGGATYGPLAPEQLLAGDGPLITANAPAAADLTKYQLGALTASGVVAFVAGTHTAAEAVLVMQPVLTGGNCQYAHTGIFNDAIVTWPAGASLDTFAERRAFFNGSFRVGQIGGGWGAV